MARSLKVEVINYVFKLHENLLICAASKWENNKYIMLLFFEIEKIIGHPIFQVLGLPVDSSIFRASSLWKSFYKLGTT